MLIAEIASRYIQVYQVNQMQMQTVSSYYIFLFKGTFHTGFSKHCIYLQQLLFSTIALGASFSEVGLI